jgi:uncharacterized protein YecE (DUF72 family)
MASAGIHVGTSGWSYDDWNGRFYPAGVRGAERLDYYAQRFDTVEVNATFYRLPNRAMIASWNRRLPERFHLVLKGSRLITHTRRLRDCGEALHTFLERARELRRLRAILWQLPPSLQRDLSLLEAFLAMLRPWVSHALEFRHESWWDDAVAALLARHGAAFVAVSHPRLPATVWPTAGLLYLRFHGLGPRLYDYRYSEAELRAWVRRIAPYRQARELYAFFNNDVRAQAPDNAESFRALLTA